MRTLAIGQILLVGLGGFVGSTLRFLISGWVHRLVPFAQLPWGTLAVNVVGCLAIGLLGGLADGMQALTASQRLFLVLGLLGGFTTFSSFAFETLALARDAEMAGAFLNVLLQVVLGLFAAWGGYAVTRWI